MAGSLVKRFIERYRRMSFYEKSIRGFLFTIGYILSPLSWWNDVFVNIPIAYVLASILSLFLGRELFPIFFVGAYLFTNVLGFMLMHVAALRLEKYSVKELAVDLFFALLYTMLIYFLSVAGFIPPLF